MKVRENLSHVACWLVIILGFFCGVYWPGSRPLVINILGLMALVAALRAAAAIFPWPEWVDPDVEIVPAKEFWGAYGSAWGATAAALAVVEAAAILFA